jgi:feruloyl-CoA synthase
VHDFPAQEPAGDAPYRDIPRWEPRIEVRKGADGTLYVEQRAALPPYPVRATEPLLEWARIKPDHTLFAERGTDGEWARLSFAETVSRVECLGQFLLDRGLSAERPLVILSGNGVAHAQLALAAVHVGIPYAAVSPAYALIASDYARLQSIFDTLSPGMVFTADAAPFEKALAAVAGPDLARLHIEGGRTPAEEFARALETIPTEAVGDAHLAVTPDTIAKFLFTSGSTGFPKAVVNTHRMICSNQIMNREVFAFFKEEPPVLLDWAPWHHTAGGNKLFFLPIFNGGTLYIDDGNPTPSGIGKTVRNLRDISPNWYFNVPKGFEALIPHLEKDKALRQSLFRNLKMIWYAGAGMAQHVWDALTRLAVETTGERIVIGTGLGATETAPAALMCTWPHEEAGNVGLPCPGVSLKLVPLDDKLDARVKGPNITPGYWKAPELTAKAFDEEGYYCFGDALRFADRNDIAAGFVFDGRTAENFKLDTGTWVNTGALRTQFIDHFGSIVRDVAIAGADRPYLTAIVFPDVEQLRSLGGLADAAGTEEIFADETVRSLFRERLESLAALSTGSSNRIRGLILADPPPDFASGEQTDKGSINQRIVLARRHALVEELYSDSPRTIGLVS